MLERSLSAAPAAALLDDPAALELPEEAEPPSVPTARRRLA
jgi:hypothetical protein